MRHVYSNSDDLVLTDCLKSATDVRIRCRNTCYVNCDREMKRFYSFSLVDERAARSIPSLPFLHPHGYVWCVCVCAQPHKRTCLGSEFCKLGVLSSPEIKAEIVAADKFTLYESCQRN